MPLSETENIAAAAEAEKAPSAAAASQPANRAPIPSAEDLAASRRDINGRFKVDQAKDVASRRAMAAKLRLAAEGDVKPAEQFELLHQAYDLLGDAGDFEGAFAAIDAIAAHFMVDAVHLKLSVLQSPTKAAQPGPVQRSAASAAATLAEQATRDCDFKGAAEASRVGEQTLAKLGRDSRDTAFVKGVRARLRQISEVQTQYKTVETALAKLKTTPDDAASNLRVGRFYCMVIGNFPKGLPYLAKGSDAAMKKLAQDELLKTEFTDGGTDVPDRWWDLSQREQGVASAKCKEHAAELYKACQPYVDEEALKRIKSRLAKVVRTGDAVDLLDMIDLATDVIAGKWQRDNNGAVVSDDANYSRIELPYKPGEEYDLRITFTPKKSYVYVSAILPKQDGFFTFISYSGFGGLESFNGRNVTEGGPSSTKLEQALVQDKKYTLVIQVRREGVKAILGDQQLCDVGSADLSKLTGYPTWALHDKGSLGIGTYHSTIAFQKVEVIEITGKGKRSR